MELVSPTGAQIGTDVLLSIENVIGGSGNDAIIVGDAHVRRASGISAGIRALAATERMVSS